MSIEAFKAGMELRSRDLGRAVLAAGRRRVAFHEEAVGVVALAMAGERTGLWGIAFGKLRRQQPVLAAVGDARDFAEQTRLWREMARTFATAGDEPQLVVSNRQTARLIAESAARFRYSDDPEVAHAAELAWWCIARREVAGSHSGVVMTEVLGEHFAIGADDGSDDDLRVWLAWLDARGGSPIGPLLERRLSEPPDPKTEVDFDEKLWPKVERRDRERSQRRDVASGSLSDVKRRQLERDIALQARNRAATVKVALLPALKSSWERLRRGVEVMETDPRPLLADLERFCETDRQSWSREVARRDRGLGMSRKASPRQAVIGLAEAELAQACWLGALVWDDPAAQAAALANGDAVDCVVTAADPDGFTARATNQGVRVRVGDSLSVADGGEHVAVDVVDVSDDAGAVSVTVEWSGAPAPVAAGARLVLWPPPPDYGRRYLGWLSGRMKEKHWALGDEHAGTSPAPVDGSGDPLAAVEALRRA